MSFCFGSLLPPTAFLGRFLRRHALQPPPRLRGRGYACAAPHALVRGLEAGIYEGLSQSGRRFLPCSRFDAMPHDRRYAMASFLRVRALRPPVPREHRLPRQRRRRGGLRGRPRSSSSTTGFAFPANTCHPGVVAMTYDIPGTGIIYNWCRYLVYDTHENNTPSIFSFFSATSRD